MPFNPSLPANNSQISSSELRSQLTSLKALVDDRPTFGNMNNAIVSGAAGNVSSVPDLSLTISNPPTQAQVQAIVDAFNGLLTVLKRE